MAPGQQCAMTALPTPRPAWCAARWAGQRQVELLVNSASLLHFPLCTRLLLLLQLGLSSTGYAVPKATFGEGTGPITWDGVRCTGREATIQQCPRAAFVDWSVAAHVDCRLACMYLTTRPLLVLQHAQGRRGCDLQGGHQGAATRCG